MRVIIYLKQSWWIRMIVYHRFFQMRKTCIDIWVLCFFLWWQTWSMFGIHEKCASDVMKQVNWLGRVLISVWTVDLWRWNHWHLSFTLFQKISSSRPNISYQSAIMVKQQWNEISSTHKINKEIEKSVFAGKTHHLNLNPASFTILPELPSSDKKVMHGFKVTNTDLHLF